MGVSVSVFSAVYYVSGQASGWVVGVINLPSIVFLNSIINPLVYTNINPLVYTYVHNISADRLFYCLQYRVLFYKRCIIKEHPVLLERPTPRIFSHWTPMDRRLASDAWGMHQLTLQLVI